MTIYSFNLTCGKDQVPQQWAFDTRAAAKGPSGIRLRYGGRQQAELLHNGCEFLGFFEILPNGGTSLTAVTKLTSALQAAAQA